MTDQEAAEILRNAGTEDGTTQEEFLAALKAGAEALDVLRAVEIQLDTNAASPEAVVHAVRWIVKNRVGAR